MREVLSGNEAIALGAYHAGVKLASAYPGTPSTEITEELAKHKDIYAEWSTNEKVAMEVAIGASYVGARAIVSMKHVGLNVASDALLAVATTGVKGGLVVVTADDPGMHSSQDEQDNRYYGKLAGIPILEPIDSQSAYALTKLAFEISEEFDTPVILRSTTRISHAKSIVETDDERVESKMSIELDRNIRKYVLLPANARNRHKINVERLAKLKDYSENFFGNEVLVGSGEFGIIASGIAYQHAKQAFPDASFLCLTMTYPLPENKIREFAGSVKKLVVCEELEPFMEEQIKSMGIEVEGKKYLPVCGEYNVDILKEAAVNAKWTVKVETKEIKPAEEFVKRAPSFCSGCPHVGLFYTLSTLGIRKQSEDKLIICGDIGCYTFGANEPFSAIDANGCMGAGIGYAHGMYHAGVKSKVVSVIGDSTFLHSGMTSLLNATYNKGNELIIILDNSNTAMTGHQVNPTCSFTAQREETKAVDLVKLCEALGADKVEVVNAFDLVAVKESVKTNLDKNGVNVLIVKGLCRVFDKSKQAKMFVSPFDCVKCGACLKLGCPAIFKDENGQIVIDHEMCLGEHCSLCAQVCAKNAISKIDYEG